MVQSSQSKAWDWTGQGRAKARAVVPYCTEKGYEQGQGQLQGQHQGKASVVQGDGKKELSPAMIQASRERVRT